MRLDLRHLQVVLAVAEAGSISRAAASLQVAQPGLTAQLHRIEQGLGGQLFVRKPDGVTLTALGEHVVVRARELVSQFDDLYATSKMLASQEQPEAPIQLGGIQGPLVPMLVSAVRELMPGRDQTTYVERSDEVILDFLQSEKLDLAVLSRWPDMQLQLPPKTKERQLFNEPIFVGLSANHPLAGRSELHLAELAGDEWTLPAQNCRGLHLNFRLACEAAGFTPRCRHFGSDLAAAVALVKSGHAIGGFYPTAYQVPGMVLKPLVGNPLRRQIVLAELEGSPVADHVDEIQARVLTLYQEVVHERPVYSTWWARHGATFALDVEP